MENQAITEAEWEVRERGHRDGLEPFLRSSVKRRGSEIPHPVYDFLFTYYSFAPAKLLRWHPGYGIDITADQGGSLLPGYIKRTPYVRDGHRYTLCSSGLGTKEVRRIGWMAQLGANLLEKGGNFGCFGMHEWAMVYRAAPGEIRHAGFPLRLSPEEIAEVVDSQPLRCTHFDAYRFFTRSARPKNSLQPDLESRLEMEQPGCIHANMDLYKWAYKMAPWCGSDVLREAFLLAMEAREIDMRASPYDLGELGFEPIRVETEAGRDAYVALQLEISRKARPIREKLVDRARAVLESAAPAAMGI